jgi:uncharacterized protein YkwD
MKHKTQHFAFILVLVVAFWGGSFVLTQEVDADPNPRDMDAEWDVLTELNHWRVRKGLMPFARNEDLDYLAEQQARYIVPMAPFTTKKVDFHSDEYGETPIERAVLFGWPIYDNPSRVLIAEIAAYYPNVAGAINFWQNSEIHRRSVEIQGYREAGVAVLQYRQWQLSFVVLGGRPDVLPVLFDPVRSTFFLSTDDSFYTDRFRPTRVAFLDDTGTRIHDTDWLPWASKIRITSGLTQDMTVIVTDGIREIETHVNLYQHRAFPSDPLPVFNTTPTPRPTLQLPIFTPAPTTLPITPTPSPTPMGERAMIKITWDDESMTLINQSSLRLDMTRLVLVSPTLGFQKTGSWMGAYSLAPLDAFPPRFCMQLWSLEYSLNSPELPSDCALLASGRNVLRASERFWMTRSFDVKYDGVTIATCVGANRICEFDIPLDN